MNNPTISAQLVCARLLDGGETLADTSQPTDRSSFCGLSNTKYGCVRKQFLIEITCAAQIWQVSAYNKTKQRNKDAGAYAHW